MNMTRGCPCTPDVMCKLEKGYNGIVSAKACGPPRLTFISVDRRAWMFHAFANSGIYATHLLQMPDSLQHQCPVLTTPWFHCQALPSFGQKQFAFVCAFVHDKAHLLYRAPSIMYSMHGGSGALFSIGLLRKVSYDQMEDCILSQWGSGKSALPSPSCTAFINPPIWSPFLTLISPSSVLWGPLCIYLNSLVCLQICLTRVADWSI